MLPIIPIHNKKKKKTIHRPIARPTKKRCVPPASAGETDAALLANRDDTVANAPKDTYKEATNDSQLESCPALPPMSLFIATNHDLGLAAEYSEDATNAALDVADTLAEEWNKESVNETQDVSHAFEEAFNVAPAEDQSTTPAPAPAAVGGVPLLGSLTSIKTFASQPPAMGMSSSHSNFLRYYYGNQAVGLQHALPANELKNVQNEENGDAEDFAGEEGEEGEKMAVRKTLASFCSRYPKPKKEKLKNDKSETDEPTDKDKTASTQQPDSSKQSTDDDPNPPNKETHPQVEIIDGEIVVRDHSLIGGVQQRTATHLIDAEFGTAIVEDETTALGAVQAKYDSYTNRTTNRKWGVDETKSFYRALRQCGSDFSMMQMFLPNRTRGQLKNKFKMESRKHPRLVDMALDPKSRVKLDLTVFGELEIPEEVPQISVPQVMISETPMAKKEEELEGEMEDNQLEDGKTEENENSMESYFDHLFNDTKDDAMKGVDKDDATNLDTADSAFDKNLINDKQSVQVADKEPEPPIFVPLAPVVRKSQAKKMKKFKPSARKVGAKK